MTRPTMFGMNGNRAMVGGEAGAEAILPLKMFWDKLKSFTAKQSSPGAVTTNHNTFYISINADGKSVDEIVNELVPKLKLRLANL